MISLEVKFFIVGGEQRKGRSVYLTTDLIFFSKITVTFTFKLKFYFEIKGHFSCTEFYILRNLLWILKHVYKFTLYHLGTECPLKQLRKTSLPSLGLQPIDTFSEWRNLFSNSHGMKLEMNVNLKHTIFTSCVSQY